MIHQGRTPDADIHAVASPISETTVVHHLTNGEEHWAVLTGTTVVARCTALEQAAELAARMNESKRAGDQYMPSAPHTAPRQSLATAPRLVRCQGLDVSPKPYPARSLAPELHGAGSPAEERSIS